VQIFLKSLDFGGEGGYKFATPLQSQNNAPGCRDAPVGNSRVNVFPLLLLSAEISRLLKHFAVRCYIFVQSSARDLGAVLLTTRSFISQLAHRVVEYYFWRMDKPSIFKPRFLDLITRGGSPKSMWMTFDYYKQVKRKNNTLGVFCEGLLQKKYIRVYKLFPL